MNSLSFSAASLFAALTLALSGAENRIPGGDAEDAASLAGYGKSVQQSADRPYAGKYCMRIAGHNSFVYTPLIEIRPDRKYRLSAVLRSAAKEKLSNTFFGIESYDKNKRKIEPVTVTVKDGTLTKVTADAKAGDTVIKVENTENWDTKPWMFPVSFAQEDGSDLPNGNVESSLVKISGKELHLAKPLKKAIPAGTRIRQHIGAGPQYCAVYSTRIPAEWKEYSAVLDGEKTDRAVNENFWPGTRYVKVLLVANFGENNGSGLDADNLTFQEIGPSSQPKKTPVRPVLNASADKTTAVYSCGEKAKFTIRTENAPRGTLEITLTRDGGEKLLSQSVDLEKTPNPSVEATLDRPGFLRCSLKLKVDGKTVAESSPAAAAFSPEKIQPGAPAPADLMKFWQNARARLDKEVPMDAKVEKIREDATHTHYKVSVANFGGTRIYGYLAVPVRPGKYPLLAMVPPAGSGQWSTSPYPGAVSIVTNVFPQEEMNQGDRYKKLNTPVWYFYQGAAGRETYFYYKSILGAARMLDYVTGRPEWNGTLVLNGRSQGGGFALILAGLYPKVNAVAADVPALCDHSAFLDQRQPGWPQLVWNVPAAAETAKYFDAAHFAKQIKCPVMISAGFIDTMCTPSSIYAAYNQIPGEKKIFNGVKTGHGWGAVMHDFNSARDLWLKQKLGLAK